MKACSYSCDGHLKMPGDLYRLRQAYYMDEEWYAKNKSKQREKEAEAAEKAAEAEAKQTAEHSTNCMCGVCFWKREAKEGRYPPVVAPPPATVTRDPQTSQNMISTAAARLGAKDDDLAKAIFAAMGTPYDSKCRHGLPFYACMSCSH